MATPHNTAPDGAFAKTVLMPGDPLRAKFIADTFLTDVKLVTSVRNVYGFTGKYKGKPVSVMASGMGMPSIGIYSWELYNFYGVENIIRVGSAGSYTDRLDVLDVCLAESAFSDSTYAECQNGDKEKVKYPSEKINKVALDKAKVLGIDCKLCKVHSSDAFYTDPKLGGWEALRDRTKAECVEMESFALFHNAQVLGKGAACMLTISDSFVTKKELSADDRQNAFRTMMELALETAISL
ncbi:MAG: purine-nucleoside phosphorylase [Bacteroidaceae bacterium]|nr:purine-nucleoside phosphorylase [Bacteroidaceae bacterium]